MNDDTLIKKETFATTDSLLVDNDRIEEEIDDESINIARYLLILWKWRFLILAILIFTFLNSSINAYRMSSIYQAEAVIQPIAKGAGGGSSDFGGSSMMVAGLSKVLSGGSTAMPTGSSDLMIWAYSRTLKKIMIEKYDLIPRLFPGHTSQNQTTPTIKQNTIVKQDKPLPLKNRIFRNIITRINPDFYRYSQKQVVSQYDEDIENGIDTLNSNINLITDNKILKLPVITITSESIDPELSKDVLKYFLETLNEQLSTDAKRTAEVNIKFLERQLEKSIDPLFRTKIYSMIASQIETAMLSDVKENFAFKIVDAPRIIPGSIKPNRTSIIITACVVAFVGSIILSFLLNVAIEYALHITLLNIVMNISIIKKIRNSKLFKK